MHLEGLVTVRSVVGEVVLDLKSARSFARAPPAAPANVAPRRVARSFLLTTGNLRNTSFWKRGTGPMKSETASPAPAPQNTAERAKGRRSLHVSVCSVFVAVVLRFLCSMISASDTQSASTSRTARTQPTPSIPHLDCPTTSSPSISPIQPPPPPVLSTYSGVRPAKC